MRHLWPVDVASSRYECLLLTGLRPADEPERRLVIWEDRKSSTFCQSGANDPTKTSASNIAVTKKNCSSPS